MASWLSWLRRCLLGGNGLSDVGSSVERGESKSLGAVRLLARDEIRRRWPRVVALSLLVGVVGAVVLSTAAGARRSRDGARAVQYGESVVECDTRRRGVPDGDAVACARSGAAGGGVRRRCMRSGFRFPGLPISLRSRRRPTRSSPTRWIVARVVAGRAAIRVGGRRDHDRRDARGQLHLGVGSHLDALSYSVAQVTRGLSRRTPIRERRPAHVCGSASSGSSADHWTSATTARRVASWR